MPTKPSFKNVHQDYWKNPEKGYPKSVWWKVVAGPPKQSILQEFDLVFSRADENYLKSL